MIKTIKFDYFSVNDEFDIQYDDGVSWSRIYEYDFVIKQLLLDEDIKNKKIHNTCWGFTGIHTQFKNNLEKICDNVLSSDIRESDEPNTIVYDITTANSEMYEQFDYVINVSTLEHIDTMGHNEIILNQLLQVKNGGYLIITFDLPRADLNAIEKLLGVKILKRGEMLNGKNSKVPNLKYDTLNCGKLVLQKL